MFVFLCPNIKGQTKGFGLFQSNWIARAYCRISGYQQSMANEGYNPLIAIQIALAGETHKVWGEVTITLK